MSTRLCPRWLCAGVLVILAMTLSACSPIVIMPDKALASAVRAEINKPLALFLTQNDLQKVQRLDASELGVRSLEGLEFCKNLSELRLNDNAITRIDRLAEIPNLVKLDLGNNQIRDIEAVAGLLFLEYLDLSGVGNVILDWTHLQANVLSGGLSAGDFLIVPRSYTLGEGDAPMAGFEGAWNALVEAGVNVYFRD